MFTDFKPIKVETVVSQESISIHQHVACIRNPICKGICVVCVLLSQLLTDEFDSVVSAAESTGGQPLLCLPFSVTVFLQLILTNRRLQKETARSNTMLSNSNFVTDRI